MTWLIVIAYVTSMLVASVPISRRLAVTPGWAGSCRSGEFTGAKGMSGYKASLASTCRDWHGPDCLHISGEVDLFDTTCAIAFAGVWPLVLPIVLLNRAANRKPTEVALRHRIAELEREVGIE
jgi:hypothetical protein